MELKDSEGWVKKFFSMLAPSDIVGFLSAAIGVAASIYATVKSLEIAIISIIVSQVLLLFGWVYILRHRYHNKIVLSQKDQEIQKLKDSIQKKDTDYEKRYSQLDKDRDHFVKQLYAISFAVKSNNIHSNDILVKIPQEAEEQYALLEKMEEIQEGTPQSEELIKSLQEEAERSARKYAQQLFEVFNRYCRDATDEALKLQNAYLELRRIQSQVSITIKLLDKPFHQGKDNPDDAIVYTAFRDNSVYNEHEREIGEIKYTISGNTAFVTCLRKDYFRINNVSSKNESYSNEHRNFDEFYNCSIAVPIKLKRADGSEKFFGFLCCDCKNEDSQISEVLDKCAAQFLYAFAQNMATFLETLDANWIDRYQDFENVSNGILEMLIKKIFKKK